MNPRLSKLQAYPFERLRALLAGVTPAATHAPIRLSIGEPQHPTPQFIRTALIDGLDGLANYPTTQGGDALRHAIARWLEQRYELPEIDAASQVLPVTGSREALFAFAQCVVDANDSAPVVLSPNPFYQIYEGAALLAGAAPEFVNQLPGNRFRFEPGSLAPATLDRVQLAYVCSPGNPSGSVMTLDDWRALFELADRHDFVVASDECYSEIYFDEGGPPLGALAASARLGRTDYRRLVVFSSLSKRSNVPGMRSGFVAGDARMLKDFLLYRTYHGCAMNPAVQRASIAAWQDETHVSENRRMYREKFAAVMPMLKDSLTFEAPEAGFYLWAETPMPDDVFARELYREYNVLVLPGRYLAREANGINPGANRVRIALVAPLEQCVEAASRIADFCRRI